jgi:hypothetical protein
MGTRADGHHKQRVVSQRAEKLRRHDGVEAAFHGSSKGCGLGLGGRQGAIRRADGMKKI